MKYRVNTRLIYKNKTVEKPFDVLAMSEKQAKRTTWQHCKLKFNKARLKIVNCELI